jgi:hypothetical protein
MLQLGLPFSEKKKIPRNSEQVGTDGSSVGIPPVLWKRKTSEFLSEPFLGREKTWEFRSKPFSDEKTSEFCSELFLKEKKPRNSVPNHFRKRKTFGIPFQTNSP